jgi:predicted enzyme related to lactoylglutathione lyase
MAVAVKHIAFFAYSVSDMARARGFYEGLLGLQRAPHCHDEWIEYVTAGGTLAISNLFTEDVAPGSCSGLAFEVVDIDAAFAELKAAGVPVRREPFETGVCKMGVVTDPDGNSLVIHQSTR